MKKQSNFRLPEWTVRQLEELKEKRGLTFTALIIMAIDDLVWKEYRATNAKLASQGDADTSE